MFKRFLASAAFAVMLGAFTFLGAQSPAGQKLYAFYATQTGRELNVVLDNLTTTVHGNGTKTVVIDLSYQFNDGVTAPVTITLLPDETVTAEGFEYLTQLLNSRPEFSTHFDKAIVGNAIILAPGIDLDTPYDPFNPGGIFDPSSPNMPLDIICKPNEIIAYGFWSTIWDWICGQLHNPGVIYSYDFPSGALHVALKVGYNAKQGWNISIGIEASDLLK
ncbi:MAG: hypothetical protein LBB40_02790 [Holophagales bacterium]|nr:hypothetical protein [Holophagales bacterium]